MAFKKGESGNPNGRPKNSLNKNTSIVKDAIAEIMSNNIDEFVLRLKGLNNRDFVNAYLQMGKYVLPTLKSQEMEVNVSAYKVPQWIEDLSAEDEDKIKANLN